MTEIGYSSYYSNKVFNGNAIRSRWNLTSTNQNRVETSTLVNLRLVQVHGCLAARETFRGFRGGFTVRLPADISRPTGNANKQLITDRVALAPLPLIIHGAQCVQDVPAIIISKNALAKI